ncbi:augmin complex subunit dgt4 [Drosophila grimshawi]|uniref:GH24146 n=1 Tax=Drosophila grimshawi TaxID=7222 RepID=B4JNG6_DROGR|nr:augmin complex subunit dgt4 [Drosophila grimshawi]EDV92259.1 GH24146 [Drosophila grimshawi]
MTESKDDVQFQDDIQYLLHLEAVKRFVEEKKNVYRQVEEHVRNYIEAKLEYKHEFERLVNLVTQVKLCSAMEEQKKLIDVKYVTNVSDQLSKICEKISSDKRPIDLDEHTLDEFKLQLEKEQRPRTKLTKQQLSYANNRETLNSLRTMLDKAENDFQKTTLAAINQLTIDLQPPTMQQQSPQETNDLPSS